MTDVLIRDLIAAYITDPVSPYRKLRHRTRVNYDGMLRRIETDYGDAALGAIKYRTLLEWHGAWSVAGKHIPMAHSLMGMVRTLIGFGLTFMEDAQCERLCAVLHRMRFEMGKPREQVLTAQQAIALRAQAHKDNLGSIALAQALQFEGTFRQKDIIGEWVPVSEPGMSEVTSERYGKWLRGLRWNSIDDNLILRHVTSKRQKLVEVDLTLAPMALEELQAAFCHFGEPLTRAMLPKTGPVIIDEETGRPYLTHKFRRKWRELARAVGIPDDVQNRDSRAGAITEATDAGAELEDVRHAAAHSNTSMTARYSRGAAKKTATVMKKRAAHRASA